MSTVHHTSPQATDIPAGFAIVAHSIARDASLSPAARLLWVILDGRQGKHASTRVGRALLAQDLGVSVRQVGTLLAELETAGLLSRTRTGRTTIYRVHNSARDGKSSAPVMGSQVPVRWEVDFLSTEQEPQRSNKQARKQVIEPSSNPADRAAAAVLTDELADPLTVEAFLAGTPAHRRPSSSETIARYLGQALASGIALPDLLAAIAEDVTNKDAGPGLTVAALKRWRSLVSPASSKQQDHHPAWCGTCDSRTRLLEIETPEGDLKPVRCACHRLSVLAVSA